ncbi:hypothetical protein F2Q68_00024825 [Brassica cretica]|uniref:Uncharacterized protein n=1 Tax=Brassica cretica TaxID=69181 RepID=A0A8S9IAY7_BRACR|nr:hypothetical protein F2Q68_00024825 [Brassica cretica]
MIGSSCYNAFRTRTVLSASVLQDSKETVLRSVKTSTSAKRRKPVSARNVAARILGEAMSALVAGSQVRSAWAAVWLIMLSLGLAAGGAYLVYKYRLRVSFSPPFSLPCEIRAIMAQYMPLDSQPEVPNHVNDEPVEESRGGEPERHGGVEEIERDEESSRRSRERRGGVDAIERDEESSRRSRERERRRRQRDRERRGVVKEIERETEASRRATEMTIQPLKTPAYSVDDSSSVDSVARRSSPRRDHQMPSESSRRHERKR